MSGWGEIGDMVGVEPDSWDEEELARQEAEWLRRELELFPDGIDAYLAVAKINVNHDHKGRFASGSGAGHVANGNESVDSLAQHTTANGDLTPERAALHAEIVAHFTADVAPSASPTVFMMGGGPASGKSSVLRDAGLATMVENRRAVHVDADAIKARLPEYQEGTRRGDAGAAMHVHRESSELSSRILATAVANRQDAVFDGTGDSNIDRLTNDVGAMRSGGHRVVANYVTVHPDIAVARSAKRAQETGRVVPETVIRGIHASVARVLPAALDAQLFDDVTVWDNSGSSARPILKAGKGRRTEVLDSSGWEAFMGQVGKSAEPPTGDEMTQMYLDLAQGRPFKGPQHHRETWNAIARDMANVPDGSVFDVPFDLAGSLAQRMTKYNRQHAADGRFGTGGTGGRAAPKTGPGKPPAPIAGEEAGAFVGREVRLNGGFTVQRATGKAPSAGYAVAVAPKKGLVLDAHEVEASPQKVRDWVKGNEKEFAQPDTFMGGWHDTDSGKVALDIVRVYPANREGRRKAIKVGRDNDQVAIYSIHEGAEIHTGGTGGYKKADKPKVSLLSPDASDDEIVSWLSSIINQ